MPLPLLKLGTILVRQAAKPFAVAIKRRAASHPRFRRVCVGFAQSYHRLEQWTLRRFYDAQGVAAETPRLREDRAVNLGAELIGEGVIFGVAGATLLYEYRRNAVKESMKEERLAYLLNRMQDQIYQLQQENDRLMIKVFPNAAYQRQEIPAIDDDNATTSWLWRMFFGSRWSQTPLHVAQIDEDGRDDRQRQQDQQGDGNGGSLEAEKQLTQSRNLPLKEKRLGYDDTSLSSSLTRTPSSSSSTDSVKGHKQK